MTARPLGKVIEEHLVKLIAAAALTFAGYVTGNAESGTETRVKVEALERQLDRLEARYNNHIERANE